MKETDKRHRVFTDAAMANTDVVVGKALNIAGLNKASFQMAWTGTPTGVYSFRISNQADACASDGTVADMTKFTNLVSPAAFSAQQPAGAASASGGVNTIGYFSFADLCGDWLLPVYTN